MLHTERPVILQIAAQESGRIQAIGAMRAAVAAARAILDPIHLLPKVIGQELLIGRP